MGGRKGTLSQAPAKRSFSQMRSPISFAAALADATPSFTFARMDSIHEGSALVQPTYESNTSRLPAPARGGRADEGGEGEEGEGGFHGGSGLLEDGFGGMA